MRRAGSEWQGHSESWLGPMANQPALRKRGVRRRGNRLTTSGQGQAQAPLGGEPPCGAHLGVLWEEWGSGRGPGLRHDKQGRWEMEGAGLNLKSASRKVSGD